MIETIFTHVGVLCAFLYYFLIDFANRKTCLTLHRYNAAWFTSDKTKFFRRSDLAELFTSTAFEKLQEVEIFVEKGYNTFQQKDLSLNNFFESWTVEILLWIPSLFEKFTRNSTFFTALFARWWFSQLSQTSFRFKVKITFCW